MNRLRPYAVIVAILCVLVVIGIAGSHLALTDIYHDTEPDLKTEWWVVRATFVLIGFLVLMTGLLAHGVIRESKQSTQV